MFGNHIKQIYQYLKKDKIPVTKFISMEKHIFTAILQLAESMGIPLAGIVILAENKYIFRFDGKTWISSAA